MATMNLYPVFDTFISSCDPDQNYSERSYLSVGAQRCCRYRALVRFDVGGIPQGATITSAVLRPYLYSNWYPNRTKVYGVHRVTSPYNGSKVNWRLQPKYQPAPSARFTIGEETQTPLDIDLTALVKGWHEERFQNHGVLIRAQDERKNSLISLQSVDYSVPGMRPVLVVNYQTLAGLVTGVGPPDCDVGQPGDIYIDVSTGSHSYRLDSPVPPGVRPVPEATGNTLLVGQTRTYQTIQAALAAAGNGDRLLLDAEEFDVTNTINVAKSVTIEGQGIGATKVVTTSLTPSPYFLFNVSVSDVVFRNMTIVEDYPRSAGETDTAIYVGNPAATGIYIDSCEIGTSEIGVWMKAAQFQITNCSFIYAPLGLPNNNYICILVSQASEGCIIHNNTFTPGAQNSGCFFVRLTNAVMPGFDGSLVVSGNTQAPSAFTLRHLIAMEEYAGHDFELFIVGNETTGEGNVPVLLYNPDFNLFSFIEFSENNVQNTSGKGLIGIDAGSTGTTGMFARGNTIANQAFAPGWASATVPPSALIGYRTSITPAPAFSLSECYWLPLI